MIGCATSMSGRTGERGMDAVRTTLNSMTDSMCSGVDGMASSMSALQNGMCGFMPAMF